MNHRLAPLGLVLALAACGAQETHAPGSSDGPTLSDAGEAARVLFLGVSKAKIEDSEAQQQRAHDAVQRVSAAFAAAGVSSTTLLQESVPAALDGLKVDEQRVRERLAALAADLHPRDTVIIYTHTHGIPTKSQSKLGGLVVTEPTTFSGPRDWLDWREYAEDLLALPAKNVVVLTMACFSGGLVSHLQDPAVKARWQQRSAEGRSFVVLTSQSDAALSNPRKIDDETINPFTYELLQALSGAADGRGDQGAAVDGQLTLGELTSYLLTETRKHTRASDAANDPEPQLAGSYDPTTPLL
jgi:hypothetical protein